MKIHVKRGSDLAWKLFCMKKAFRSIKRHISLTSERPEGENLLQGWIYDLTDCAGYWAGGFSRAPAQYQRKTFRQIWTARHLLLKALNHDFDEDVFDEINRRLAHEFKADSIMYVSSPDEDQILENGEVLPPSPRRDAILTKAYEMVENAFLKKTLAETRRKQVIAQALYIVTDNFDTWWE